MNSDRELAPFVAAAIAGVMANPVHAHKGTSPADLADLAIEAARSAASKLGLVETEEHLAPARYDVDELGEIASALHRRIDDLEAKLAAPSAEGKPAVNAGA